MSEAADHTPLTPGPINTRSPTPGPEPKNGLLNRPWTSDVLFWIAIAFLAFFGFAGVRSAIRVSTGPFGTIPTWWTEILTLTFTTAVWFFICFWVPALIRQAVRSSRRRKALALGPGTAEPGWHVDPLNSTHYRWWDGTKWSDVVAPAISHRSKGLLGVTLLVLVLAAPLLVFSIWGIAQPSSGTASQPSADPSTNPNTSLAVEVALSSLLESTEDFLTTPVDRDNLAESMRQATKKFPAVESDYEYFNAVIGAVTTQDELGQGAPSLQSLRQLDGEMGEWLTVRQDYLSALQPCLQESSNYAYAGCAAPISERFEASLQSTMLSTGAAFQAVVDSINGR